MIGILYKGVVLGIGLRGDISPTHIHLGTRSTTFKSTLGNVEARHCKRSLQKRRELVDPLIRNTLRATASLPSYVESRSEYTTSGNMPRTHSRHFQGSTFRQAGATFIMCAPLGVL